MKKKNRLQMLAALLAATLSMVLTSPVAVKANEDYNVEKKEAAVDTGRIYYLKNSHGDVIGQIDENGNVLTSYAYNAFGEQVSAVAVQGEQKSTTNRFLYAGEQYDETSGLYYLQARHYDVKAGRFTQEDTYLGDGRNLYAYVHSNPLKYVDPTGHYTEEIFDGDVDAWDEKIKYEGGGSSNVETPVYKGTSRPVNSGATPNSIYEQLNPDGTVKSRAFYNESGQQFNRQDFDHQHFDKSTQQSYQPHEHSYHYNENGYRDGVWDEPLTSGYTNVSI